MYRLILLAVIAFGLCGAAQADACRFRPLRWLFHRHCRSNCSAQAGACADSCRPRSILARRESPGDGPAMPGCIGGQCFTP